MIYLEPLQLGWRPLVESWLNTVPVYITPPLRTLIMTMADEMIGPLLNFTRKNCREIVETSQSMRVNALLRFFTVLFKEMEEEKNVKVLETWVKGTFLFCVIWSLGATLDTDSRKKFDTFIKTLHNGDDAEHPVTTKFDVPFPEEGSVYDFVFEVCTACTDYLDPSRIVKVRHLCRILAVLFFLHPNPNPTRSQLQLQPQHLVMFVCFSVEAKASGSSGWQPSIWSWSSNLAKS
jgi:hypothetical protein